MHLSIYLSNYLSIYLFIYLSTYLSTYLPIYLYQLHWLKNHVRPLHVSISTCFLLPELLRWFIYPFPGLQRTFGSLSGPVSWRLSLRSRWPEASTKLIHQPPMIASQCQIGRNRAFLIYSWSYYLILSYFPVTQRYPEWHWDLRDPEVDVQWMYW